MNTVTTRTAQIGRELGLSDDRVQEVLALHERSLVIDGSSMIYIEGQSMPTEYDRYITGGIDVVNHTVTSPDAELPQVLHEVQSARRWLERHSEMLVQITKVSDIEEARAADKAGIIFGPQDAAYLGNDLSRVGMFYELGLRVIQLTYQRRNSVGDGCGEPAAGGLSLFGRDVVKEMDEYGIVIDLSHVSETTSYDAIKYSRNPVILTHAQPAAVTPHVRAKSDDFLRAMADSGGVIGVTALNSFVRRGDAKRAKLSDFVHHIEYLLDLIGPDHVGLGLDFDETKTWEEEVAFLHTIPDLDMSNFDEERWEDHYVDDLSHGSMAPRVTLALAAAGHDDETIEKILGKNFLRVFEQVWK